MRIIVGFFLGDQKYSNVADLLKNTPALYFREYVVSCDLGVHSASILERRQLCVGNKHETRLFPIKVKALLFFDFPEREGKGQ